MIRKIARALGAGSLLFLPACNVHAVGGFAVEVGRGDDHTYLARLALTERWNKTERPPQNVWRLAGYWELSAGAWDNADESTADVGFTPVFRFERSALYVEAAVGARLVQARISAHRSFSTALQFGDHVGIGMHSGKYDFAVRIQHLSNGGFRSPNPGINFVTVRVQYNLD